MDNKNYYELPARLPTNGCTLIYTKNGIITAAEILRPDQYIASLDTFIELATQAGYSISGPEIE